MSRIRGKDTGPERLVRAFLHRSGLRFRLYGQGLWGKPDLVFPGRRVCLFVHGCFWHGCSRCVDGTRKVKSNSSYWQKKVAGNKARDKRTVLRLRRDGWRVFTVWECETTSEQRLRSLVRRIQSVRGVRR